MHENEQRTKPNMDRALDLVSGIVLSQWSVHFLFISQNFKSFDFNLDVEYKF